MQTRQFYLVLAVLAVVAAESADAQTLRVSRASVELMYDSARSAQLPFFTNARQVSLAAKKGGLRLISVTNDVTLDNVEYPYVLPRTLEFINTIAAEYHAACGERLIVTSGTRPTGEQPRNASPESVHPTGMAVDFRLPNGPCRAWRRDRLMVMENQGIIEATEERHPRHLHVAVLGGNRAQYAAAAKSPITTSVGGEVAPAESGRQRTRARR